jgi:hypothetical protein
VAGILLLLNNSLWIYFGLVGGEIYLYFSGRGILVRVEMRRQSIQIGTPKAVAEAYTFLSIWALIAAVTIAMAAFSL